MSDALRESGCFPGTMVRLVATGEDSGEVDEMVRRAAAGLEEEARKRASQVAFMGSQVLYLFLALYIVGRFQSGLYVFVPTGM